jgi:hypothetical protein
VVTGTRTPKEDMTTAGILKKPILKKREGSRDEGVTGDGRKDKDPSERKRTIYIFGAKIQEGGGLSENQ